MKTLTAVLPTSEVRNARWPKANLETVGYFELQAIKDNRIVELARVRFMMGRSSSANRVTCLVWFYDRKDGPSFSGDGQASGYGYDKQSAAFQSALSDSGVTLKNSDGETTYIDGAGECMVKAALEAIGVAMGYPLESLNIAGFY